MYKVGVDIGGTKVNVGIFDDAGNIVACRKIWVKDINDLADVLAKTVMNLCASAGVPASKLESCGIGIPGTVGDDGRTILKAPNIDILKDTLCADVERILNLPTSLVQDSRAAAWGEYLFGGGREKNCVVCITIGTGIGCGIVANGKILNGALGYAGEIGHIPVAENGRKCGCGKCGCVEKYSAGGGLDITAAEILGDGKTAADLFDAAKYGNKQAVNAVNDAVHLLGNVLVSVINTISPDCVLLSGGLSEQVDLYAKPIIEYIKNHCYSAGRLPDIRLAELKDKAPLYGAAYIPIQHKKEPLLSASIMCADILNMQSALDEIERAGINYLHCDIMDNHFVPNLMLPTEFLNKLKSGTAMPFDYHIMAENPESVIEKLEISDGDIVSVHYESTVHLQRAISLIKEKGAKASVAINPATPINVLDEVLPQLDMVLIMTVNPGFSGQKITPGSIDKIYRMKKKLSDMNLDKVLIEVDGNCSFENVPKMYSAGADVLVVGTSSVFKPDTSIAEGTSKLLNLLS